MSCSDCALGCTGLIKQNTWWWRARYLKTLVLSSASHLPRPPKTQQTHWTPLGTRAGSADGGGGFSKMTWRCYCWLFCQQHHELIQPCTACSQSGRAPFKNDPVTVAVFTVLLSGCIWFHMSHVGCPSQLVVCTKRKSKIKYQIPCVYFFHGN